MAGMSMLLLTWLFIIMNPEWLVLLGWVLSVIQTKATELLSMNTFTRIWILLKLWLMNSGIIWIWDMILMGHLELKGLVALVNPVPTSMESWIITSQPLVLGHVAPTRTFWLISTTFLRALFAWQKTTEDQDLLQLWNQQLQHLHHLVRMKSRQGNVKSCWQRENVPRRRSGKSAWRLVENATNATRILSIPSSCPYQLACFQNSNYMLLIIIGNNNLESNGCSARFWI